VSRPASPGEPEQAVLPREQSGLRIAGPLSGNSCLSPISEFEQKHWRALRTKDAFRSLKHAQFSSFDVNLDYVDLMNFHFGRQVVESSLSQHNWTDTKLRTNRPIPDFSLGARQKGTRRSSQGPAKQQATSTRAQQFCATLTRNKR
jgi:hypothetical protein